MFVCVGCPYVCSLQIVSIYILLLQEIIAHPLGVGYIPFQFNKPLYVGATADFKDGFVGCMSSLQVNGETLDLYEKVRSDDRFTYGLELGGCATVELN